MNRLHRILTSATLLTLLPLAAQAHPGHELHASFAAGLMHPLTGLDHLAVLLCLGVLAAGRGIRLALGTGALLVVCAGFTLLHGLEQGEEALTGSLPAFFAGFTLAGAALFAGGAWLARLAKQQLRVRPSALRQVQKNHSHRQR